jgi:DNA-directed RNA polymerase subunit K/omega
MLYGRRLDQSLQHVDGSRYALVHAVAKRARQITLWLTADPAELRAEAAPPPAPGELTSRDPVALAEAEILDGEVKVRWDPEGLADEAGLLEIDEIETDPLLIEGLEDDDGAAGEDDNTALTPALAQVLEGDAAEAAEVVEGAEEDADPVEEEDDVVATVSGTNAPDEVEEISLEDVEEPDDDDEEQPDE